MTPSSTKKIKQRRSTSYVFIWLSLFFWINRRLLTLLVIDVQYVEQLKENVTGIHRVQIVLKEIKNVFIPMLTKERNVIQ